MTYDPEVDAACVNLREPEARKGRVTSLPVEDAPGMIVLDFDRMDASLASKFWMHRSCYRRSFWIRPSVVDSTLGSGCIAEHWRKES